MSDLRTRLIRLAAAKPELRADLLPLLQEQADPASVDQNKPESYYGLPPKGIQASTGLSRASIQSLARNKGLSITTKRLKALGLDFDLDFGKPSTPLYPNWRKYQLDWIRLNALSGPELPQGLEALQRHLQYFNESERELFDAANQFASGRGIRASTTRTASRYELPGRAPGSMIAFGIDRALGRYFQYWPDDEMPSLDQEFLDQGEIITLLKKHGKPSSDLQKAVEAFAMDLDPSVAGLRGFSASTRRRA